MVVEWKSNKIIWGRLFSWRVFAVATCVLFVKQHFVSWYLFNILYKHTEAKDFDSNCENIKWNILIFTFQIEIKVIDCLSSLVWHRFVSLKTLASCGILLQHTILCSCFVTFTYSTLLVIIFVWFYGSISYIFVT